MPRVSRSGQRALSPKDHDSLLDTLQARFAANANRHPQVTWAKVQARLEAQPGKLRPLHGMERTGGEPDVVAIDGRTGEVLFVDCAPQSPAGRRSLCFDEAALQARKKAKPRGSAEGMAAELGIALLTDAQYRHLQTLGEFDTTTSSWVMTPPDIRRRGGALFCDRRYGAVFLYHNGAESYYAARGFRGALVV